LAFFFFALRLPSALAGDSAARFLSRFGNLRDILRDGDLGTSRRFAKSGTKRVPGAAPADLDTAKGA
jgi:hypothetical protein